MLELAALLELLELELLASALLFELLELEALLLELLELEALLLELEELLPQPVKAKEQQRTAADTNAITFFMYKYLLSELISINQITLTLCTNTKTTFKIAIISAITFFMTANLNKCNQSKINILHYNSCKNLSKR